MAGILFSQKGSNRTRKILRTCKWVGSSLCPLASLDIVYLESLGGCLYFIENSILL